MTPCRMVSNLKLSSFLSSDPSALLPHCRLNPLYSLLNNCSTHLCFSILNLEIYPTSNRERREMEVEVLIPASAVDFDFNSARSSPFSTAPNSPKRFGDFYFSAPTSPTRVSEFYRDFENFSRIDHGKRSGRSSVIPFNWEETPGTPKSPKAGTKIEDEFAFDFNEDLEKASLSAEELFDGGKIRPLKPPPRLQIGRAVDEAFNRKSPVSSPRSPKSPLSQGKRIIRNAFSPKHKKKDFDPFSAAIENASNGTKQGRGREREPNFPSSSSSRRGTRSLSPIRVAEYAWEEEEPHKQNANLNQSSTDATTSSSSSCSKGYRKWKLKDFFLFRSASEGRSADKDPLKKYTGLFKRQEDAKNTSFRSTEGSGSRRRGVPSAHELHYKTNKAVSEGLKKKTFLPYKQGILGRLAFNPAVHALSNGFGTFTHK